MLAGTIYTCCRRARHASRHTAKPAQCRLKQCGGTAVGESTESTIQSTTGWNEDDYWQPSCGTSALVMSPGMLRRDISRRFFIKQRAGSRPALPRLLLYIMNSSGLN